MDAKFRGSYQRMEASLQKLTDSIAAYNPSDSASIELEKANAATQQNVAELYEHQRNYLRIQELRATSDSLDETIKNTIRLLADTRKEIMSIPMVDTADRREIDVDQLLSYAKFIAPTTVPPTFRKPLPEELQAQKHDAQDSADAQISNGIATPQEDANPAYIKSENIGRKAMEEREKAWLIPQNLPFEPWPNQAVMAGGALAKIQKMVEAGVDPAGVLTAEEQAEVDRKREEQKEVERKRQEETERRHREEFGDYTRKKAENAVPFNPDDL